MKTYPCGTIPRKNDFVKYMGEKEQYLNQMAYVYTYYGGVADIIIIDSNKNVCEGSSMLIKDLSTLEFITRNFAVGDKVVVNRGNIEYVIDHIKENKCVLSLNGKIEIIVNALELTHSEDMTN